MKDRIEALLDRVVEAVEDLPPRDRKLALALLALAAFVLVGGAAFGLKSVIDDRASRVVAVKDHLVEAQDLATEYELLKAKLGDVETRMGQFKASQVSTYLEGWAGTAGVLPTLKEVRETGAETVGAYRKRTYRVEFADADLAGLVKFLHAVETSPYPMKVRSARFKAEDRREERPIDLQLELVTFSREEGS